VKDTIIHTVIAAICGAFVAYLNVLAVPIIVMLVVMIIDYCTGLAGAYVTGTLNSRIGVKGIVKKVGYIALVAVGMVADYLITTALVQVGIDLKINYCVGMIITIWLIINELISILENLSEIGIPLPNFFVNLIKRLKNTVESNTDE
jgi:toxin secretion/phage lysis holin